VIGIFYVSHNITKKIGDSFFEDFYWVETKECDGNENSLDLMVILFFIFHEYYQNYQNCNEL
jgi:hypothetical protein